MIHYERLIALHPEARLPRRRIMAVPHQDLDRWCTTEAETVLSTVVETYRNLLSAANRDREVHAGMIGTVGSLLYTLISYIHWGERSFRFSDGLAEMLVDTDIPEMTGADFGVPFPVFYVEFPTMFLAELDNFPNHRHIGCYVHDLRPTKDEIVVKFVNNPEESKTLGHSLFGRINVPRDGRVSFDGFDETCNRLSRYSNVIGNGNSLGNVVVDDLARKLFNERVEIFSRYTEALHRFLVNGLLYLMGGSTVDRTNIEQPWQRLARRVERASSAHRPALQTELQTLPRTQVYLLGRTVKISYHAPSLGDNSREACERRELITRKLVRGHWQRYWEGEGRTQCVWHLKAPFLRNVDAPVESVRVRYKAT